jgi:hypothetical protein
MNMDITDIIYKGNKPKDKLFIVLVTKYRKSYCLTSNRITRRVQQDDIEYTEVKFLKKVLLVKSKEKIIEGQRLEDLKNCCDKMKALIDKEGEKPWEDL